VKRGGLTVGVRLRKSSRIRQKDLKNGGKLPPRTGATRGANDTKAVTKIAKGAEGTQGHSRCKVSIEELGRCRQKKLWEKNSAGIEEKYRGHPVLEGERKR